MFNLHVHITGRDFQIMMYFIPENCFYIHVLANSEDPDDVPRYGAFSWAFIVCQNVTHL